MKKKTLCVFYVATVLAVTLVGFMPILGYGEPDGTSLEVVPRPIFKSVGDTFVVNVTLYDVTDLMAFEYKFQWNSTLLSSTGYTKVDPVNDLGWGMNFQAKDALTAGQHWFAIAALLDPSTTSFNGSVVLASYTFQVAGSGSCVLDILDDKLGNSSALQIPRTVEDGYFSTPSNPEGRFTYSPMFPLVGETVTFNASASYDPDGTVVSYEWDFGDGAADTGMVVTHGYSAVGAYNVSLTVTDNEGLTDITWQIVGIETGGTVAAFDYSPKLPLKGQTVTFNATESRAAPPGHIVNYTWNFGDGNITIIGDDEPITQIIKHIYDVTGTYNITLTVADNASSTHMTWHTVKVGGILGDINGDGIVNMTDLLIVALAFGSHPGHPRWNAITDLKPDNKIDIFDLVIIGINFGKKG